MMSREKTTSKVSREQATKEFIKWLDAKRVSESRRISNEDIEVEIIDAICDGYLILNEDNSWTQKLKFPLDGASPLSEVKLPFRLNIGVINAKLRGIKSDDIVKRIHTYVCVLTDQPTGIINALDTADYSIASNIATYFF